MDDLEKQITAYHEAGHALVAAALPGNDPVHKITILPRGRALGYTMVLPDQVDEVGRMAKRLGQEENWSNSGFRDPLAKVMYASRGSKVFKPARSRVTLSPEQTEARKASRVPRGSRTA